MEINSTGAMLFDDYRFSDPLGKMTEYGENGNQSFAEILKSSTLHTGETGTVTHPQPIDKTDKLYEQCLELETFLIKTLIGSMRKTIQKSGLINEGFAGKMYEDMLYDEYARDFTKNAGFGLADQAYLELSGRRGTLY